MTYEEMMAILNGYYEESEYLDDELDYVASKPTYRNFGLAVKESYLEYVNEVNYDE